MEVGKSEPWKRQSESKSLTPRSWFVTKQKQIAYVKAITITYNKTSMKNIIIPASLIAIFVACNRPSKDLATVEIGMTKTEVINIVGEPPKKEVVNETEVWDYPDSARTVVFRADTVYAIMTSPKARLDSMSKWLDSTNQKVKKGFGKVGDKLDNAADKIKDKLKKDTSDPK